MSGRYVDLLKRIPEREHLYLKHHLRTGNYPIYFYKKGEEPFFMTGKIHLQIKDKDRLDDIVRKYYLTFIEETWVKTFYSVKVENDQDAVEIARQILDNEKDVITAEPGSKVDIQLY